MLASLLSSGSHSQYTFSAGPREVLNPKEAMALMETNMDAVTAELDAGVRALSLNEQQACGLYANFPRDQ